MPELLRPKEIGDADFAWTRKYGTAVSIMGTFGVSNYHDVDGRSTECLLHCRGKRYSLQILKY